MNTPVTSSVPDRLGDSPGGRFLRAWLGHQPTLGAALGLHEYDGRLPNVSPAGLAAYRAFLESALADLDASPPPRTDLELLDATLTRKVAATALFELAALREPGRNPLAHTGPLDVTVYLKRDYAPAARRLSALARHLEALPVYLGWAARGLEPSLPRPHAEAALETLGGWVAFAEGELRGEMAALSPDAALAARLESARVGAVASALEFADAVAGRELDDRWRLGPDHLASLLRLSEGVEVPVERLLELGEADLAANKAALVATARAINPHLGPRGVLLELSRDHPAAGELIATAAAQLEKLRAFVVDSGVASIPEDIPCTVRATPGFLRPAPAMLDWCGPFEERGAESYYYLTPPEPGWSPEESGEWLARFGRRTLSVISAHEVWPGHHLHSLHMRRAPTPLARAVTTYSHVEGWSHYGEELALELGPGRDDPACRLAQLTEALVRNVRLVCAIEMHTRGMTIPEATKRFVADAFVDARAAEAEARRGAIDPGYLNYTLGKLMLRKLHRDVRLRHEAEGRPFLLKDFNNTFLAYGSPPVPLLRRFMLGEVGEVL